MDDRQVGLRTVILALGGIALLAWGIVLAEENSDPLLRPDRGCTEIVTGPLVPVTEAIDESGRTREDAAASSAPAGATAAVGFTTDPAWDLLQTVSVFQRLKPGDRFAVQFDESMQGLVSLALSDPLTVKARQAVDRAPTWLQKELEDQFSKMATTVQQDKWADEVLNATDPYVDETAFLAAHISRNDLASASFNAQIVRDSADYAYEVDPFLDYVEVVDYGSAAGGGDYYTALRYQVELDGVVSSVEYPREYYYWWVISPRGSDEPPAYIDPVPCSSAGTPAAPPTGKFWREWFFYGATNKRGGLCDIHWDGSASEPCPLLRDMLADVQTLWAHRPNTSGPSNGAVGMVNEWVRQSLGPFGDRDGCRPVQPVDVYYHTDGNCGEWADLTIAAARAALIPTEETGTQVNDHVWNEFYDQQWGRWVQWEPVNNMIDSNYSGWWGGKIAATHTYRADGYGHSDRTSQHGPSATLRVTVFDANHYPVDGAKVQLGSEYDPLPVLIMSTTQGHTNAQGQITFTVGDSRNYYVIVTTPWGTFPASGWRKVITNAVGGTTYAWSPPNFTGAVPRLSVSAATPSGTQDANLIETEFAVTEGIVHGDSFVSASLGYAKDHLGDLDFFVADQANWDLFISSQAFQALDFSIDYAGRSSSFVPSQAGDHYVAWSNKASLDMAQVVAGSVRLYHNNGSVPPVSQLTVGKDAGLASLLDWEDVSGHNVDGYNVYRSTSPEDVGAARTQSQLEPYLLATVVASQHADPEAAPLDTCFFYSIRTHSNQDGISP